MRVNQIKKKDEEIIQEENQVFGRTKLLNDEIFHYCPGCGHGVVHRLLMEVVEEIGIQETIIGVTPVGCSVFAYFYMEIDMQEASHGRAPAVATGIKRMFPSKYVFSYQGDGDLAAIGTAETVHACNRGENITIIYINNGIYGMTGGQMAPTTLVNMVSTTTPAGRNVKQMGNPLKITDLVATLPGTCFVSRQAVHKPSYVRNAKKAIRKAFEYQKQDLGLSFIEFVSNCNSNWKMTPVEANEWLENNMLPFYPLGDIKTPDKDKLHKIKNSIYE